MSALHYSLAPDAGHHLMMAALAMARSDTLCLYNGREMARPQADYAKQDMIKAAEAFGLVVIDPTDVSALRVFIQRFAPACGLRAYEEERA